MSKPPEPAAVTPAPPPSVLAPGVVVGGLIAGKYRVERLIGSGGMGLVLAAAQLPLDRIVAIKLIRPEHLEDARAVERLLREAKAAASIQSEHVARVLDVGMLDNGAPFIVMEYLEGQDLDTVLRRDGPLATIDAVDFILEACEAIAEAHRNRIVHRDIKPANLFVARLPGGGVCIKVVDFGISKLMSGSDTASLTEASRVVGTLYHMAPEQLQGAEVDARTDVWALGGLLFEMLTGQKPFRDVAWPAVCAQILSGAAPDLSLLGQSTPEDLRLTIRKCLSRSADERFANVAEFAVAIMPYGSRRARNSLERIVQLATSTGSLAAQALNPATARAEAPRDGHGKPSRAELHTSLDARQAHRSPDSSSGPLSSERATISTRREHWVVGSIVSLLLLLVVLQPSIRKWTVVPTEPTVPPTTPIAVPELITQANPQLEALREVALALSAAEPPPKRDVEASPAPEVALPPAANTKRDAIGSNPSSNGGQHAPTASFTASGTRAPTRLTAPPAPQPPAPSNPVPTAADAQPSSQPAASERSAPTLDHPTKAPAADTPPPVPASSGSSSRRRAAADAGASRRAGDPWDLRDVGFE